MAKQTYSQRLRWVTLAESTKPRASETLQERNRASAPVPEKPKPRRGRPPKVRTDG